MNRQQFVTLPTRLRSLFGRGQGKWKRGSRKIIHNYLKPPLGGHTFQLAQDQSIAHAAQAFKVFGHTTLRGILSRAELAEVSSGLAELGAGPTVEASTATLAPVEKSRKIQDIVFQPDLLTLFQKLLDPFWYVGSDAYVGSPVFSNHRDTFLNPPFYKIFIPLVPCTFSVLPGSHRAGDVYSREVGKYATEWDNGNMLAFPTSELHMRRDGSKIVKNLTTTSPEDLFVHRRLDPGDIFIFSQNAVHGLISKESKNFFIAVTVVPSPATSTEYGLTRTEHLDMIINNIASTSAVDFQLSGHRKSKPEENIFTGYKFKEEDLSHLTKSHSWNDNFGLRFIEKERWIQTFNGLRHQGFQHIQDEL